MTYRSELSDLPEANETLQEFVNTDNITFQAELDAAANIYNGEEGSGDSADAMMEDWPQGWGNAFTEALTAPASARVLSTCPRSHAELSAPYFDL